MMEGLKEEEGGTATASGSGGGYTQTPGQKGTSPPLPIHRIGSVEESSGRRRSQDRSSQARLSTARSSAASASMPVSLYTTIEDEISQDCIVMGVEEHVREILSVLQFNVLADALSDPDGEEGTTLSLAAVVTFVVSIL